MIVRASLPAVVSVSNELGTPRYPSTRGMLAARRQPPLRRNAEELVAGRPHVLELVRLEVPEVQGRCEVIDGDSPEVTVRQLLGRLRERGLIGA